MPHELQDGLNQPRNQRNFSNCAQTIRLCYHIRVHVFHYVLCGVVSASSAGLDFGYEKLEKVLATLNGWIIQY